MAIFVIPGGPVCIAHTDHLQYTFVIPSILFEGALCALSLYRLLAVRKSLLGYQDNYTKIVDPLLLDTFIYFIRYVEYPVIFHGCVLPQPLNLSLSVEGIYVSCLVIWLFSPVRSAVIFHRSSADSDVIFTEKFI